MEKKIAWLLTAVVLLSAGLWAVNQWLSWRTLQQEQGLELQSWGETTPSYRGEALSQLYIIQPQEKTFYRVLDGAIAQQFLDSIRDEPMDTAPNQQTQIGLLMETPTQRTIVYLREPRSPQAEELEALVQVALEGQEIVVKEWAQQYVDVYSLISPLQITSIEAYATEKEVIEGQVEKYSLSLETNDSQEIAQLMELLKSVTVDSMELKEEKTDLSGIEQTDGYHLVFSLGESYQYQTIEVYGSRYAFTVDLDFQWQQRLYTQHYEESRRILQGLRGLPSTKVEILAPDQAPIEEQPSPPRLPESDIIPLPEGLHMLEDAENKKTLE